jgi:hypothetical protein
MTLYASPTTNEFCGDSWSQNGLEMLFATNPSHTYFVEAGGGEIICCILPNETYTVPNVLYQATSVVSTGKCGGVPVTYYNGTWSWDIWYVDVGLIFACRLSCAVYASCTLFP